MWCDRVFRGVERDAVGASKTFSMDSFSMGCVDRITRSKQLGSKKSIFHTWYRTRHPILSPVGNRFFFFPHVLERRHENKPPGHASDRPHSVPATRCNVKRTMIVFMRHRPTLQGDVWRRQRFHLISGTSPIPISRFKTLTGQIGA